MSRKIPIVISGVGNRVLPKKPESSNWLGWAEQIKRMGHFQLVAAHDVSETSLQHIVSSGYLRSSQTYTDIDLMLREVSCDAILIANPAEHHAVTMKKAIVNNLHILVEKPFVNNLVDGKELLGLIKKAGIVVSVVQNWRCKDVGRILCESIRSGVIGKVGYIFFRYIRNRENSNYPSYIFTEKLPLLYAMGVHHLDLFRFILQQEYKSVSGYSFKPPWSLYKSDTGLNLFLETKNGTKIVYTGTISSKNNVIPQESLVIEGESGTLLNESQWLEPPLWCYLQDKRERINLTTEIDDISTAGQYNKSDKVILENFYKAIMGMENSICTATDAFHSVAVLEASALACKTGKSVFLDSFL